MKEISVLAVVLVTALYGYSQQTVSTDLLTVNGSKHFTWTEYVNEQGIRIDYTFSNCDPSMGYDTESVLIRVENTTSSDVNLDWLMHMYYNGECKTCDYPDEYHYELTVPAGQTIEGSCDIYGDYRLKMLSRFIQEGYENSTELTGFQLSELKITN